MTSTEQAFQALLSNQMVAFAAHMATQFPDLDEERIIQMANDHCSGLSLVEAAAAIPKGKAKRGSGKTKRTGTPTKRQEPSPDERCMARVWQTGSGCDQCSKSRADGDYCKSHAKKAAIGELAIQVHPDSVGLAHVPASARLGLWCGRIDEFQDGEDGVPPYKDQEGIIRIEWTSDDMKARVSAEVDAGTARFAGGGEKKKAKRKTKSPQTVDTHMADDLELSNQDTSTTGLLEALAEDPVDGVGGEPVVNKAEEPVVNDKPQSILDEQMTSDGTSIYDAETEPEDDGEEMEVDERVHDGETYYVEPSSGDIYNVETGDVIGHWEGDAATGSPTLN